MNRSRLLLILSATILVSFIDLPASADESSNSQSSYAIDQDLPVAGQLLTASEQLYGMKSDLASVAFLTSTFVANDAADAGMCETWVNTASICLDDSDAAAQKEACSSADNLVEQLYGDFLRTATNISSDPNVFSNVHALSAVAVEELLYKLNSFGYANVLTTEFCNKDLQDKQQMMQFAKTLGDPGRAMGPIGASGNASSGSKESNSCSGSGAAKMGVYGPDPAPDMYSGTDGGGAGPRDLAKGLPGTIGTQMGSAMCPIQPRPSASTEDNDKEKELEEKQRREAEQKAEEEKKKAEEEKQKEEKQKAEQEQQQQQATQQPPQQTQQSTDPKFSCSGSSCTYTNGDFVVAGGKNSFGSGGWGFVGGKVGDGNVAIGNAGMAGFSPGGGFFVTTGFGILFIPSPESDVPMGGVCGGFSSSVASCLIAHMKEESDKEEDCRNKIMQHCAMAECSQEYMNSLCSDGPDGAGAIDLTLTPGYGKVDPTDEGPTKPSAGDPCAADPLGKPMTQTQKQACCAAEPDDPQCLGGGGDGGNPVYYQGGIANQHVATPQTSLTSTAIRARGLNANSLRSLSNRSF